MKNTEPLVIRNLLILERNQRTVVGYLFGVEGYLAADTS